MRNIALCIQYKGSMYHGWQRQENSLSVQQVMEEAIQNVCCEKVTVYGCGRTDTGVHALNYICNFNSQTKIPDEKIPYALNCVLPDDIRVMKAKTVDADFHSRFSAKRKRYIYKILNSPHSDVFMKDLSWHYRREINMEHVKKACKYFLGEHDFSAFCASGAQTSMHTRTIYSLDAEKSGDMITIDICGNGFLYNMVRIITGTLAYVGDGRIQPDGVENIILVGDRRLAGITAPACGLYMAQVDYGFELF